MALDGTSPVIVFNFYKEINVPNFLKGFVDTVKIPLLPIPFYLDEKLLSIALDNYTRSISANILRDGGSTFERLESDSVVLTFSARKDNIQVTAFTAMIERIIKILEKQSYSISLFFDNIILLNASLEQFDTSIRGAGDTDLREISITLANRPEKPVAGITPLARFTGNSSGLIN